MAGWIVILIVLALMGSVFWIMPSSRDRQRMHLRQYAMSKGLKVRVPDKALKERLIRYEDMILGSIIYESLNFSHHKIAFSGVLYVVKNKDGDWGFTDASIPSAINEEKVLNEVSSLPDSCCLVVIASGSSLVFWDERGEDGNIDLIQKALSEINVAMSLK